MLITCWSVKGGSGTTVVAASLAVIAARTADALLVDLAGDVPAVLGMAEPSGPGVGDWLDAADDVAVAALRRLEVDAIPRLTVLPRGSSPTSTARLGALAAGLAAEPRTVIVDAGLLTSPSATPSTFELASSATASLLVLRPCYLALRRAVAAPLRPSGVVLVAEPMRSLQRGDVEDVVGVPVVAEVPWDPAVARAVDAGLLASRLPAPLVRPLRRVA